MADLSGLGDLVLSVGGDITPLESALNEIPGVAQTAADQIQAAFDAIPSATAEVESSLANLSAGLSEAGTNAGEAAGHIDEVPPALHDTSEAAGEAGEKLKEFLEAGLELAGIALTFEALKEAVTEIVSAFDQLQRAEISLTALTGSAEGAAASIDQLKTMAMGEGLSFPSLVQAQQRMVAFGVSASQIPQLLQAAANSAAAMGTDIESAANKLDRIAISGTAAARQLTQLGLTTHDLATAMGVADTEVAAAFKALDQSDRIDVLVAAMQKFQGVAAAVADTLSGRWQTFKTSMEVALEGIGEVIDTGLTQAIATAQASVIPGIQAMTQAFKDMAAIVGPIIGAAVNSVTQSFGDLLTVVSSGVSALASIATQSNVTGISLGQLVSYVGNVTPWGLFSSSVHQAATDLELLHADEDMAAASALVMNERFSGVTDSLKSFIDKTSAGHDSLLVIRTDFDALKQAVTDAQTHLDLVKEAYDKGFASAGQLEAATKALATAQTALNGTLDTSRLTMSGIASSYDALKTAVETTSANLTMVATAYAQGTASLSQYDTALKEAKSAQDALNGSMRLTPAQDVAQHFQELQDNLSHAERYLQAVTDALQTGGATMSMYSKAVADLNAAQTALNGTATTTAATLDASAPKVIDVANALQSMAIQTGSAKQAASDFVGPVQQAADSIQMLGTNSLTTSGFSKTLQAGVEVLRGSVESLSTASTAAGDAAVYMGNHWVSAAALVQEAARTMVDAATAEHDALVSVTQAAQQAADAVNSVGSGSMNSSILEGLSGFGGQGGGGTGHIAPGGFITMPNAGQIGNVGGGPLTVQMNTMTVDPAGFAQEVQSALQSGDWSGLQGQGALMGPQLSRAATNLNTSAAALTTAAQTQQDAAQTAYDAAKLATIGANNLTSAASGLQTANDAISASSLNADTLSANAIVGAAAILSQAGTAATAAAATLTSAGTTLVGAATTLNTAVQAAAAPVRGTNTLTSTMPAVALPNVGPNGASTGGLPFAVPQFQQGPQSATVNLSVNAPGFIQSLMNQFVQQLQSQGYVLRRS